MILDISDFAFKQIFEDQRLHLPIQWDGVDFTGTLGKLFNTYIGSFDRILAKEDKRGDKSQSTHSVKQICGLIRNSVGSYLDGFPSKAYIELEKAMHLLVRTPVEDLSKEHF